ncbi:MAG: hypothetical protein JWN83_289 [Chitinophagaceae bacterium]|nr:hypothetical protein [Chitinophagaceae bacterium]
MQFEITFKNEKEKTYRLIILFFVILHALFFTYLLWDKTLWKTGVGGLIIIILYSGYRLLMSRTSEQKFSYGSGIFFLFMLFFSVLFSWWLLITETVLSVLSYVLLQHKSIYFNSYSIELRARPYKRYKWADLNNVILKDDILTLDFKNNKLLQGEIETTNINENAFNTFAKEQLVNTSN